MPSPLAALLGYDRETVDHVNRHMYRSFHGRRSGAVPWAVFALRHEVYCLEQGFLDPADYADGLEVDEHDACSTHVAAYTMDEALVGTVRLVQPPAGMPFPFELCCATSADVDMPPRAACAEVSRLMIRPSHRRGRADNLRGIPGLDRGADAGTHPRGHRSTSPMLLLGMYREIYRHSRRQGVRYWFAAMERSLAHALSRMGFRFEAIGPQADYYGAVRPYMLDLAGLATELRAANPVLAAWFDEPALGDTVGAQARQSAPASDAIMLAA